MKTTAKKTEQREETLLWLAVRSAALTVNGSACRDGGGGAVAELVVVLLQSCCAWRILALLEVAGVGPSERNLHHRDLHLLWSRRVSRVDAPMGI